MFQSAHSGKPKPVDAAVYKEDELALHHGSFIIDPVGRRRLSGAGAVSISLKYQRDDRY